MARRLDPLPETNTEMFTDVHKRETKQQVTESPSAIQLTDGCR
jgi:hypothetical protein